MGGRGWRRRGGRRRQDGVLIPTVRGDADLNVWRAVEIPGAAASVREAGRLPGSDRDAAASAASIRPPMDYIKSFLPYPSTLSWRSGHLDRTILGAGRRNACHRARARDELRYKKQRSRMWQFAGGYDGAGVKIISL